jgi:thiol-disulfide isomerase/thioredoxin
MFERLLIAGLLIVAGTVLWIGYNRLSVRWLAHIAPTDPVLAELREGIPTVLYFTTPFCVPCRTLQQPALRDLEAELGSAGIQVIEIDSAQQPEVADRWGVFSAPTTFILDRNRTPRQVNRGVASVETLKRQIQAVA